MQKIGGNYESLASFLLHNKNVVEFDLLPFWNGVGFTFQRESVGLA